MHVAALRRHSSESLHHHAVPFRQPDFNHLLGTSGAVSNDASLRVNSTARKCASFSPTRATSTIVPFAHDSSHYTAPLQCAAQEGVYIALTTFIIPGEIYRKVCA